MKSVSSLGQLQKKADKRMQEIGKILNPRSLISGQPTQVMHHLLPKSVSARLRYDWENLIPLTNAEHCRLHQSGDPSIEMEIVKKRGGIEWFEKLRAKGRETIKVNRLYYENVMEKLENHLERKI